jgi:uncharacterized protein YndB with AHSA1/START domain
MSPSTRPTGLTRQAGWEIGVRRTLPMPLEPMWELITGPAGLRLWLGEAPGLAIAPGSTYLLADGTHGALTVVKPFSHLRLTWQPADWPRASIIQLRVLPGGERSVVSFHQEQLPDEAARAARRASFSAALDQLEQLLGAGAAPRS